MFDIAQYIENLLETEPFYSLMNELRMFDKDTYEHSVVVASLAFELGMEQYYSFEKCKRLAKAGLLHDIGILKVPKQIVKRDGFYDKDDYAYMKKHTQYGYDILKNLNVEEELCEVCLYHHERINGSGYPKGLRKKEIPEMAQFIGFLEVFVAYNSDKFFRKKYNYVEALSIMSQYGPGDFDNKYISPMYKLCTRKNL